MGGYFQLPLYVPIVFMDPRSSNDVDGDRHGGLFSGMIAGA